MRKPYYSFMVLLFLLTACTSQSTKKNTEFFAYKKTQETRTVDAFTQVRVQGRLNVTLHTGYRRPRILLTGDPRDLYQVKAVVSDQRLFLTLGKGFPKYGAVHADIQGGALSRFDYEGEGTIRGNRLHTRYLELNLRNNGSTQLGGTIGLRRLWINGHGAVSLNGLTGQGVQVHVQGHPKVELSGVANISHLDMDGPGWLSYHWVKSEVLTIRARDHARIQLAGVANRLDVELWEYAYFKGRYLRAKRSFVRTHNHSVAEISAVQHQSNLATGHSDIYYYNLPKTRADFMAYDGSVLDMREWENTAQYDRYNRQFP